VSTISLSLSHTHSLPHSHTPPLSLALTHPLPQVCAFNAAAKYLSPGDKVVVIDQGGGWGGQWVDQYHFVRLHQPYSIFTAGERQWSFAKTRPASHLATRKEILAHFEDIVTSNEREGALDLVPLFGYQYTDHAIVDGAVELTVQSMAARFEGALHRPPADLPPVPGKSRNQC
jgi:alkylhydroperoxidase family enzyme